jgi:hypothetical protein
MIRFLIDKTKIINSLAIVSRKAFSSIPFKLAQTPAEGLAKDVIVFNYENPKKFKLLNLFAISQMFFWSYLGHWSYTELRDVRVSLIKFYKHIAIN